MCAGGGESASGRPVRVVDTRRLATLRVQGAWWKRIATKIEMVSGHSIDSSERVSKFGKGTVELFRNAAGSSKDTRTAKARSSELHREFSCWQRTNPLHLSLCFI